MRDFLHSHTLFWRKLSLFLAFSFFVSGCHTGNEPVPVPQITEKKERAGDILPARSRNVTKNGNTETVQTQSENSYNKPWASFEADASSTMLPEKQNTKSDKNRIYGSSPNAKNKTKVIIRDPFALPEALRIPQPSSSGTQATKNPHQPPSVRQTAPPDSQEPCVAGIFDNGKEKFAIIRWLQVQGVFRCGESLGNGYYIKEITAATVRLCPEAGSSGANNITLTIK